MSEGYYFPDEKIGLSGYFLGGPSASAIVFDMADVESVILALCARTGDDPDDYTSTEIDI